MRKTLSILGGLALALVLSQFPEYAQQYAQRLGGAVDELRIITEAFDQAADQSGLTREQALGRYSGTDDSFIVDRGVSMAATFARYEQLSAMLVRIQGADAWERFTLLPDFLDTDIGARALQNFQPAVPVTMEGFAYAGGGFLVGYLSLSALVSVLMLPFRPRRPRRPPASLVAQETAADPPPPAVRRPPPPAVTRPPPVPSPVPEPPPPQMAAPPPPTPASHPVRLAVQGPDPDEVKRAVLELTGRPPHLPPEPPERI